MTSTQGKIIIAPDVNVRPHEMDTARVLANSGMTVEFLRCSTEYRVTSPDILINGISWEIKAPTASNAKAIERNLRKALHQSSNIIFDSRRMKHMPDAIVERELRKFALVIKGIKKLVFVNRHCQIIDIK